eukprot:g4401.t1
MQALQKRVEILMIPMPVISGPTSGTTQCEEFSEWFRQSERWTIGACEVFHYFVVKRRRYNCSAAMSYGTWFVIYYGFILCSLTLTGPVSKSIAEEGKASSMRLGDLLKLGIPGQPVDRLEQDETEALSQQMRSLAQQELLRSQLGLDLDAEVSAPRSRFNSAANWPVYQPGSLPGQPFLQHLEEHRAVVIGHPGRVAGVS